MMTMNNTGGVPIGRFTLLHENKVMLVRLEKRVTRIFSGICIGIIF